MEGNRWLVTIQGGDRDYPPLDRPGFLEFTRSLRSPALYEAIKDAEPIGLVSGYRATENQLFHYERLAAVARILRRARRHGVRFQSGLRPGHDYGCIGSSRSRELSEDGAAKALTALRAGFNADSPASTVTPWMLATSEDLRYVGVEGAKAGRATKQMHKYMDYVLRSATRSESVRNRFLQVQGMLNGPGVIFRPSVVLQVAKQAFSSGSKVISGTALMDGCEISNSLEIHFERSHHAQSQHLAVAELLSGWLKRRL